MTDTDFIGKYCNISGDRHTIYKITNYYDEHPQYKCVGKSFVELINCINKTYILSITQIKIINDYVVPTPKFKIGDLIVLYKKINDISIKCEYKIINIRIFYYGINYIIEDIITKKKSKDIEQSIICRMIEDEDDEETYDYINKSEDWNDNSFNINEYVYVRYIYNDTDIDYKYGKIIKIYSDTHYIVRYDNDVAIVSGNRLSRLLKL